MVCCTEYNSTDFATKPAKLPFLKVFLHTFTHVYAMWGEFRHMLFRYTGWASNFAIPTVCSTSTSCVLSHEP